MKKNLLLSLFGLGLLFFILNSNASGPGLVQGIDRTGSPLSPGTCATTGCHTGGAFDPMLEIELLDNGVPVTQYEPGESYEMVATITAGTGSPEVYGLQAVALTGMDDESAGLFEAPSGMRITVIDGRDYLEHSTPGASNTFTAEWTAPPAGTGEVRFYAAANAANGNGLNTGDGIASIELTVPEVSTSTREETAAGFDLSVFPNPARTQATVTVNSERATEANLRLFDLEGRLLQQRSLSLLAGANRQPVDLSRLSTGYYQIVVTGAGAYRAALLQVQ